MIEQVAAQAQWFLPQLIELLHSPEVALLPAMPFVSFVGTGAEAEGDDPPWARLWATGQGAADPPVKADLVPAIAITEDELRLSDELVGACYAWRGYDVAGRDDVSPIGQREVTLLAWTGSQPVGTMTMGFDDGGGLHADRTYGRQLASLRGKGRTVCEFTRFAVSSTADSKATISGLFDLSYVLARRMLGVTDVVVEVNPRHVGFYRRSFGFEPISDVRNCERVNAPAVLLRLDVSKLEGRMRDVGAMTPGQLTLARG